MVTSKPIPIRVDGEEYIIVWQDRHNIQRLIVYQYGAILGRKDFQFDVDQGRGVVEYAVRAIIRASPSIASAKNGEIQNTKLDRLNKRLRQIIVSLC